LAAALLFAAGAGRAAAASWTISPTQSLGARQGVLTSVSCVSTADCVAVGLSFRDDPNFTEPLIEQWNGRQWRVQHAPLPKYVNQGQLFDVSCAIADACVAVGDVTGGGGTFPLAERWNGAAWSPLNVPRPFSLGSFDEATLVGVICFSRRACLAVGADDDANVPLAERWNGRRWWVQRTPGAGDASFLSAVSCTSTTACTAVGTDQDADSTGCQRPLIERLTGARWSVVPIPPMPDCSTLNGSGLNSVWCPSPGACTAVGQYDRGNDNYERPLTEHARAGDWSIQPTPGVAYRVDPWGGAGNLYGVTCSSPSACIAVGQAGSPLRGIPIAEYGSGGRWAVQPLGEGLVGGGGFNGVACVNKRSCVAVGFAGNLTIEPLVEQLRR
jgi:hypothetical protein